MGKEIVTEGVDYYNIEVVREVGVGVRALGGRGEVGEAGGE